MQGGWKTECLWIFDPKETSGSNMRDEFSNADFSSLTHCRLYATISVADLMADCLRPIDPPNNPLTHRPTDRPTHRSIDRPADQTTPPPACIPARRCARVSRSESAAERPRGPRRDRAAETERRRAANACARRDWRLGEREARAATNMGREASFENGGRTDNNQVQQVKQHYVLLSKINLRGNIAGIVLIWWI